MPHFIVECTENIREEARYLSCLPVLTPHWRQRGFFRLGEYVAGRTGSIPGKWLMASTITPLCI
ncbi:5-carboxymethyl-2-hydroxymuconate delta-isomerase [Escherichia coli]|nr:5-carboxymethyl-2-hydroxymuconate delta-isomerase [Escherichia coli]